MKHLYSVFVLFGLYFIGEIIVNITNIFIPAGIIGMILLFVLLCLKIINAETIRETASFLLDNMILFLLPAAVGILTVWNLVADKLIPYIIMNIVTTLLIFAATGCTAQGLITIRKNKEDKAGVKMRNGNS